MADEKIFKPAYLNLGKPLLKEKCRKGKQLLAPCRLCPRRCEVNRLSGELGFCKTPYKAQVSSYNIHTGEEPPISAQHGSGTIFFSHCNMKCIFCQNFPISQIGVGEATEIAQLADMMVSLQKRGAHNINFVTPSHVVPQILEALLVAIDWGLSIPLVYNTNGYDSLEELELLDGVIDVYMPDAKYADNAIARQLSGPADYVEVNRAALKEMNRQVGVLKCDENGVAQRGLLVRHLVLPGGYSGTESVMKFIAEELGVETYISLMSQYFPAHKSHSHETMSRMITREEYRQALRAMEKYGLENGFKQATP